MMETDEDNRKAEFHFAAFTAISHLSLPFLQKVRAKMEMLLERDEVNIRDIKEVIAASESDLVKALCGVSFCKLSQPVDCVSECVETRDQDSSEDPPEDENTSHIVGECFVREEVDSLEEAPEQEDDVIVDTKDDEVALDFSMAVGDTIQVPEQVHKEAFEDEGDEADHIVPQEPLSLPFPTVVVDVGLIDPDLSQHSKNEESDSVAPIVAPAEIELEEHCIQDNEEEKEDSQQEVAENAPQSVEAIPDQAEDKTKQIITELEQSDCEEENTPITVVAECDIQPAVQVPLASVDSKLVSDSVEPACQQPADEPVPVALLPVETNVIPQNDDDLPVEIASPQDVAASPSDVVLPEPRSLLPAPQIHVAPVPVDPKVSTADDVTSPTDTVPPVQRSLFPAHPRRNSAANPPFSGAGGSIATQPATESRHFNFARIGDVPEPWDPSLAVADFHSVVISEATDPTDFYVARYYDEGTNDVAAMMTAWWKNERNNPEISLKPAAIVPGLPVAVVTSPSIIERGVVVSADPGQTSAFVRFIDKGCVNSVNFSRLCHITKLQMSDQFPKQAIHCTVDIHAHQFQDGRAVWPPQVMNSLRKAVETKAQYTAVFAGEKDGKTVVNLYIPRYGYEEKKSFLAHVCKYMAIWKRRRHSPAESQLSVFGETSSDMSQSEVDSTLDTDLEDGDSDGTLLDVDIDLDNEIENADSTS